MANFLYLKIPRSNLSYHPIIKLKDIGTVVCKDEKVKAAIQEITIYEFKTSGNIVMSVMKIMELIQHRYPELCVVNQGETDFIIEYRSKAPNEKEQIAKLIVVCILLFFGAAFTIMAFHNDIELQKLLYQLRFFVTGDDKVGIGGLEIGYTIGLGIGILVFFNHVGRKKLTHDPTPIQVEMRKYEKDVDQAFMENSSRKGAVEDATDD